MPSGLRVVYLASGDAHSPPPCVEVLLDGEQQTTLGFDVVLFEHGSNYGRLINGFNKWFDIFLHIGGTLS